MRMKIHIVVGLMFSTWSFWFEGEEEKEEEIYKIEQMMFTFIMCSTHNKHNMPESYETKREYL